jgi:hypothetical protein
MTRASGKDLSNIGWLLYFAVGTDFRHAASEKPRPGKSRGIRWTKRGWVGGWGSLYDSDLTTRSVVCEVTVRFPSYRNHLHCARLLRRRGFAEMRTTSGRFGRRDRAVGVGSHPRRPRPFDQALLDETTPGGRRRRI